MKALLFSLSWLAACAPSVALPAWPQPSDVEPATSSQAPWRLEDEAGAWSDAVAPGRDIPPPGFARTLDEGCRLAAVSPAALPACVWTGAVGTWQSEALAVAEDPPAATGRRTDRVLLMMAALLIVALLHVGYRRPVRRQRRVWLSPIRRRRDGAPGAARPALRRLGGLPDRIASLPPE